MSRYFDPTKETKERLLAIVNGTDKRQRSHMSRILADRELTKRGFDWCEQ
jgi:hypothetical protein